MPDAEPNPTDTTEQLAKQLASDVIVPLRSAGGRPLGITEVDSDIRQLREMHRRQVRFYKAEQRAVERLLAPTRKLLSDLEIQKLRVGLTMLSDEDLHKRIEAIDVFLQRITRGSLEVTKAHETIVGASDDLQLQAQIRAEFIRAAHTFTDADWKMLDDVRELQRKQNHRGAFLRCRHPAPWSPADGAETEEDADGNA